jgi:hypothetical protein
VTRTDGPSHNRSAPVADASPVGPPLTAAEQRELLERLRLVQGVRHGGAHIQSRSAPVLHNGESTVAARDVAEAAVPVATPPRDITGPGITSSVAMEAADLGIMRWDPDRNAIAAMFGDNFDFRGLRGEWQAPSIVMYDLEYNVLGIPATDNRIVMGRRRQLWAFPRPNPDYTTILPCDFIKVNGVWYVAAMVTQGLGNEKWTVFWQSRDLVDWEQTNPYLSLAHKDGRRPIGHPGNIMLTFDQIGDYVYIFGTGGLRRDRGIWMWRNKADEFPHGWWEPWGWDGRRWGWGIANELSPVLEGRYGELSFRYVDGNCVLSYFDAVGYRQQAKTVLNPVDNWRTEANVVDYASGRDIPQLYGGFISPLSRLNESEGMHFLVSQWNTVTGTNDPYKVMLIADTLGAVGVSRDSLQPVARSAELPAPTDSVASAEPDGASVIPAPPDYGETTSPHKSAAKRTAPAKSAPKNAASKAPAKANRGGTSVGP